GDVLAGIIGALVCSLPPFEAACAGVFLHAAAAERWSASHADRGLLAYEIADLVPALIGELLRERSP
ncbi:MAG: NAD(P)H-hydrate dehydratase, partial [Polyangiaceae bacterium]